jgi:two-component system chemotaxis response regulator CheY
MARILIVENSSFMKGALKFLLENAGHVVIGTAADGQEALQLYQSRKPDVVTVDLLMGGADGLPILKALRQADPGAKIIVVSIFGQEARLDEARQLGMAGWIAKPYKYQEIVDEIQKVLAGQRG